MSKKYTVTTPSLLAVDDSFDDERFMKVRIDVLESDVEARGHGIRFSRDCLEKAKDLFANIPILANVITKKDKDGNEVLDYGSHDFHVENDKFNDGEGKIIYDEKVVGIVPEDNEVEITDNDAGHAVLSLNAFLFKDYGNYACEILESRGGKTSVSAEIDVSDEVYIEEDDIDEVGTILPWGITFLGEDVDPAIASANAVMLSANEEKRQAQLASIMQELKESLDNYTKAVLAAKNNDGKEEPNVNHFDELLAKYNLSAEDITFEHENLSDEELDKAFETFMAEKDKGSSVELGKTEDKNKVEMSVTINGKTTNLSKSLSDVIYAMSDLVNQTYAADGDYYAVDVFDDGTAKSKYVIMMGCYGGKAYKQSWCLKDGNYTLKGEREEVFSEWMTAEEKEKLNTMRSNYSALSAEVDGIKEKLSKYESEPEKMSILQKDEYEMISETKEYNELLSDHFDVSKEDLSAKLDSILLSYVKEHSKKANLAVKDNKPKEVGMKAFPTTTSGTAGRYGGIFSK